MNLHNHAKFRVADNYTLYRSLHLGCNGNAGSEYILVRTSDERRYDFNSQKEVKTFFEQIGESVEWTSDPQWKEIKEG